MKKLFRLLASMSASVMLFGCNSNSNNNSNQSQTNVNKITLTGTGKIYAKGTQHVIVTIPEENKSSVQFKKEQKAEYYTLSSSLTGKKVTEAEYTSDSSVILTLEGTINNNTATTDALENAISVASNAFSKDITAASSIKYNNGSPQVKFSLGITKGIAEDHKSFTMYLMYVDLPYGDFKKDMCTADHVKFTNATMYSCDVTDDLGSLKIIVNDINGVASITLDSETTTFNKEIKKELNFDATDILNVPTLTYDLY